MQWQGELRSGKKKKLNAGVNTDTTKCNDRRVNIFCFSRMLLIAKLCQKC